MSQDISIFTLLSEAIDNGRFTHEVSVRRADVIDLPGLSRYCHEHFGPEAWRIGETDQPLIDLDRRWFVMGWSFYFDREEDAVAFSLRF